MCGRFASFHGPAAIRDAFRTVGDIPNLEPSWNVAPSQAAMVVRLHPKTGERHLDLLRWGLVPNATTNIKLALKPINARSESAGRSGMFRAALARRRCLVPISAFYEWRTGSDGKQPFAIARVDQAPLVMAGLWEVWLDPEGVLLRTFAILTTSANTTMRTLHERMPVILEPRDWSAWLGETSVAVSGLMRPAGDDVLELWPVSEAVNNVRNNGAELLNRIDDPAAPPPSDAAAGANPA